MKQKKDYAFAANCIGVFLGILQEQFTDTEIKKMLQANKIAGYLEILNNKEPARYIEHKARAGE